MEASELSDRLKETLTTINIDGDIITDQLAQAVQVPSMAWFPGEFEEALRAGAFTTESWGICYNGGLDEDQDDIVDRDLRLIWETIHPGRPYPLDAE